jgi:hypothetical protein
VFALAEKLNVSLLRTTAPRVLVALSGANSYFRLPI